MKAFSLIETIAAMILASLLLLLAWSALQFLLRYQQTRANALSMQSEEALFLYKIQLDFLSGRQIADSPPHTLALYQPASLDTIFYVFAPACVYRKNRNLIDSFKVQNTVLWANRQKCTLRIRNHKTPFHLSPLAVAGCLPKPPLHAPQHVSQTN